MLQVRAVEKPSCGLARGRKKATENTRAIAKNVRGHVAGIFTKGASRAILVESTVKRDTVLFLTDQGLHSEHMKGK
jgi:hypothetical protein